MVSNNSLSLRLEMASHLKPGEIEHKVFDILLLYLPENGKLSTKDAADLIDGLYPTKRPGDEKESPEEFLSNLWNITNRLAGQIDCDTVPMNRLVSLIKTVRDLPSKQTLQPLAPSDYRRRVWQDLPGMFLDLGELYRRECLMLLRTKSLDAKICALEINIFGLQPETTEYLRWRNTNSFIALLAAEGMGSCYYYALLTARMALEEVKTKTKEKKEMKTIVQCYVPVAATYFILCTPALYDACLLRWGADSGHVGGPLWNGVRGYSVERWQFWMSRFEELAGHEFATSETKAKALDAMARMGHARDQQANQGEE